MSEPLWTHESPTVSTELADESGTLALTLTTGGGKTARSISTELAPGEVVELWDALGDWLGIRP